MSDTATMGVGDVVVLRSGGYPVPEGSKGRVSLEVSDGFWLVDFGTPAVHLVREAHLTVVEKAPDAPPSAPTPDAGTHLTMDVFEREDFDDEPADEADPYPDDLRDVVRGQTLALLSATTREAVRCANNALAEALDATVPEEPARETLTDRLIAFLGTRQGQVLMDMAVQYMTPIAPKAPTPNLTVTGPHGTEVQVFDGELLLAHRMVGASGTLRVAVPRKMLTVKTAPYVGDAARGVATLLDFTEESHALDALVADANVHGAPAAPKADATPAGEAVS